MSLQYQHSEFNINIKKQVGRLLAFIILFQKKIENIRIKLAGNEQFHTKLAFNLIDQKRKNKLYSNDLFEFVNKSTQSPIIQANAELFCKKYSAETNIISSNQAGLNNGVYSLSSHQFFKFLCPRTNKSLSNTLMLRVQPKSTQSLPTSLNKLFTQLLSSTIQMLIITESLKKRIHEPNQLTFIEIIELIFKNCQSPHSLYNFINQSADNNQEYDFGLNDLRFLCYHLKENKCEDIDDLSNEDIRELIMPIQKCKVNGRISEENVNKNVFSKTNYFLPETNPYFYQNGESQKENKKMTTTSVNFLNVNYKQTSKNFYKSKQKFFPHQSNSRFDSDDDYQFAQGVKTKLPTPMITNGYRQNYANHSFKRNQHQPTVTNRLSNNLNLNNNDTILSNSILSNTDNRNSYRMDNGMFMIEKFVKNEQNIESQSIASSIRSQRRNPIFTNNQQYKENQFIQKFEDDYYNNRSQLSEDASRNSAFVQY